MATSINWQGIKNQLSNTPPKQIYNEKGFKIADTRPPTAHWPQHNPYDLPTQGHEWIDHPQD